MALSVAETKEGRALLLNAVMRQNHALTRDELWGMLFERWPHYVHYRGRGTAVHCPPTEYGMLGKHALTSCDWIVPGTL